MPQYANDFEQGSPQLDLSIKETGRHVFTLGFLYLLTAFCLSWWIDASTSLFTDVVIVGGLLATTGFLSLLLTRRERIRSGFYEFTDCANASIESKAKELMMSRLNMPVVGESGDEVEIPDTSVSSEEELEALGAIARELNGLEDQLHTEKSQTAFSANWRQLAGLDKGE